MDAIVTAEDEASSNPSRAYLQLAALFLVRKKKSLKVAKKKWFLCKIASGFHF